MFSGIQEAHLNAYIIMQEFAEDFAKSRIPFDYTTRTVNTISLVILNCDLNRRSAKRILSVAGSLYAGRDLEQVIGAIKFVASLRLNR